MTYIVIVNNYLTKIFTTWAGLRRTSVFQGKKVLLYKVITGVRGLDQRP